MNRLTPALVPLMCALLLAPPASGADRSLADALAATGATHASKGNLAQAKDALYKALAYDDTCPEAIFELAKIFEKEGSNVEAGDFYQRAAVIMSQESKPACAAKRAEAERKLKSLNPFASRLLTVYEDYVSEMDKVVKKIPDTLTHDTAVQRIKDLKLTSVLPAEKLPKFYQEASVVVAKPPKTSGSSSRNGDTTSSSTPYSGVTAPDVERELKALGWDTIKGTWTKKGANTFETTSGRLESKKTVGGIDVQIWKTFTGTVNVTVRDEGTESSSSSGSFYRGSMNGYGLSLRKDCKVYAPGGWSGWTMGGSKYESYLYNTFPIPADAPKLHVTLTAMDPLFEFVLNDKKMLRYNDKNTPVKGQMVIEVDGTATIESPRAGGN